MPFAVLSQNADAPLKHKPKDIQYLCKQAWVSMRNHVKANTFLASDVGMVGYLGPNTGVGKPGDRPVLEFFYTDRGLEFRDNLLQELRRVLPQNINVILCPVKEGEHSGWGTDPVWAVKPIITI